MMQKRWDVELLFLSGPLSLQGSKKFHGPIIRIGKRPGPGGVDLRSYQGVAEVHATIQAYEGNKVSISPIKPHIIRVAEHENVNWRHVHPLPKAAYLSEGDVVHIGSLERGCRFKFIKCESFEWHQNKILSNVEQNKDEFIRNRIETTKIESSVPPWFYPSLGVMLSLSLSAVLFLLLPYLAPEPLTGIRYESIEAFEQFEKSTIVSEDEEVEESLLEGFQRPFDEMVMCVNGKYSDLNLCGNPKAWDKRFYEKTVKKMQQLSHYKHYWKIVHRARKDYAYVINALRQEKLPEIFAGIPMQETYYQKRAVSFVCAAGIWQFMPETAKRVNLPVSSCRIKGKGSNYRWSPEKLAPPRNAPYRGATRCLLGKCDVDERIPVDLSTKGAIRLLYEAWNNTEAQQSGSLVQMTIISHNAGFNDGKLRGKTRWTQTGNVLPSYRAYMKQKKPPNGSKYYGDNILCDKSGAHAIATMNNRCGGFILNQPQHYGYSTVAKHFVALCYYAKNYGNDPVFAKYDKYVNGYCKQLKTPSVKRLGVER